ncbi:hypothetical protein SCG7086_AO_00050 [Chlamydiales bacterium SCGC AG-110-P3]|nr:hypothetical protein SCG7086_AO_00050 [Chlamydiales bacterium SCGC AG-110-P3]
MKELFPIREEELDLLKSAQKEERKVIQKNISGFFANLTERNRRIIFTLKELDTLIPKDPQEQANKTIEYEKLSKLAKTDEGEFLKESKKLVFAGLWANIRRQFTGYSVLLLPIAWVNFQLSSKHSYWNLIGGQETDDKMCRFLWTILNAEQAKAEKEDLDSAFSSLLTDTGLIPWGFRGQIGRLCGDRIYGKSLIDLVSSPDV